MAPDMKRSHSEVAATGEPASKKIQKFDAVGRDAGDDDGSVPSSEVSAEEVFEVVAGYVGCLLCHTLKR
jgi:hypothetical protein